MLIFLTNPSISPTDTKSPVLIGLSNRRIRPDTKFPAISCIPNPIPSASAPEIIASPLRSTPACVRPNNRATIKPTYPKSVISASLAPRSIIICWSHLLSIHRLSQPIRAKINVNNNIPPINCAGTS